MSGGGGVDGGGGEVVVVGCQVPSLPPPRPRSPPPYPDLYGKRRELAMLQMLEREKGFLEEELKFVESLQPASRCCKEVADFVAAKSDPLILTKKQISRSCGLWRWLCGSWSCCFSWFCCCNGCSCHLKRPTCSCCSPCDCNLCSSCSCSCSFPKSQCCSCPPCPCCCTMTSCPKSSCSCCKFKLPSCLRSSCCKCVCSCPKPQDLYPCFRCRKNCCDPTCCICY
ncbi:hypothetical protein Droror1_Dr00001411 [Drosera rotundifolia]